jgi:hypothetical protein
LYKYTFTFKKNDIFLEVTTSDRKYIDSEMEKWVYAISGKSDEINPVNMLQELYEDTKKSTKEPQKEAVAVKQKIVEETVIEPETKNEFDSVLITKIKEEPVNEVIEKQVAEVQKVISSIKQIISEKKPETMHDFLIVAAYYLSKFEGLDRFSIKQINAKVFAFAKKPIDHSLIQKAVNNGYIKVVPDYTGMADVTEYELTLEGEEYYINEI